MMFQASEPIEVFIGEFAILGLALFIVWRIVVWVREAPVRPDPWDAEVENQLAGPDAVEVCPHCLTEQPSTAWFCQKCGSAVGPYNNLMPYIQVFSEGEVFRNGASGRFRNRPLVLTGFVLIALSSSLVFAPVILLFLLANWQRPGGGTKWIEDSDRQ